LNIMEIVENQAASSVPLRFTSSSKRRKITYPTIR
jgi:hypothetical protein